MTEHRLSSAHTTVREGWYLLAGGRWLAIGILAVATAATAALIRTETTLATEAIRTERAAITAGRDVTRLRVDEGGIDVSRCLALRTWTDIDAVATVSAASSIDGLDVVTYAGDLDAVLGLHDSSPKPAILGADIATLVGTSQGTIAVQSVRFPTARGPNSTRARTLRNVVALPVDTNETSQECWVALRVGANPNIDAALSTHLATGSTIAIAERQADLPTTNENADEFLADAIHGGWRLLGLIVGLALVAFLYVRRADLALYNDLGFPYRFRLSMALVASLTIVIVGVSFGTLAGTAIALVDLGPGEAELGSANAALAPFVAQIVLIATLGSIFAARAPGLSTRR